MYFHNGFMCNSPNSVQALVCKYEFWHASNRLPLKKWIWNKIPFYAGSLFIFLTWWVILKKPSQNITEEIKHLSYRGVKKSPKKQLASTFLFLKPDFDAPFSMCTVLKSNLQFLILPRLLFLWISTSKKEKKHVFQLFKYITACQIGL